MEHRTAKNRGGQKVREEITGAKGGRKLQRKGECTGLGYFRLCKLYSTLNKKKYTIRFQKEGNQRKQKNSAQEGGGSHRRLLF